MFDPGMTISAGTNASRSTQGGRNSVVFTIPIGGDLAFLGFLRVAAGTGADAASFGEAVPTSAEAESVRREGTQAQVSGGACAVWLFGTGRRAGASKPRPGGRGRAMSGGEWTRDTGEDLGRG
jgi:hypothetical protein